jgi:hypothetical protein
MYLFCSTTTTSKYSPMETRPRQRNIRKHETTHQRKIQIWIENGTAGVPSTKRSRSSHPQFQIPFPQRTRWDGGVISTPPMGQTTPTNQNYPKPTATIDATPTVSAYTHLSGPFYYNKMPLAPMGCKVQIHENVVVPFCRWMVFINVTRTLHSPQLLCQNNPGGKSHRHHPIQAQ